ncbi:MAG TPA: chorismate lyase [Burkholderiales bacterium]|nr:chorismate lyase [Burkholderiales bacterium]
MNSISRDIYWRGTPPAGRYRAWLDDGGSLTARIRARCRTFSVAVQASGPARADADERALIGVARGIRAHVREVHLCCGDTALVFARSLVDPDNERACSALDRLGTRPLGSALFSAAGGPRHGLRFRRLDRRHALYRRVCRSLAAPPATLWARRSLFELHGAPLLVTEVFLPAILEL